MKKLHIPGGINIGESRVSEGEKHKGFKKSGKGASKITPSGKARKGKA